MDGQKLADILAAFERKLLVQHSAAEANARAAETARKQVDMFIDEVLLPEINALVEPLRAAGHEITLTENPRVHGNAASERSVGLLITPRARTGPPLDASFGRDAHGRDLVVHCPAGEAFGRIEWGTFAANRAKDDVAHLLLKIVAKALPA